MKQTLMNKIIMPAVLVGSLALGSGCPRVSGITPAGRNFGNSLLFNVIDREIGINQYERYGMQGGSQAQLPENIYMREGKWHPAPGYVWMDPNNPNDYRIRKIKLIKIK